ncbi:unnamed protein product [Dibothriocephalus latus]|uniref:Helix-turn-helix domain-containing protein n=1 Tax=Dibothriocephalus latus TaxID=60516 RepID=A0A3P6SNC3_DIBLA|nr:unnamed protein product [Dibothriocephalus latus]
MQVLNYNSNHPIGHKRSCVRGLYRRVETHCNEAEDKVAELPHIRRLLRANGYPCNLANQCIRKRGKKQHPTGPKVWRALPYMKNVSEAIYTSIVKLLAAFTLSVLVLHLRKEHQTWYFVCKRVRSFVIMVMTIADHTNDRLRVRDTRIPSVILILSVDRFLLRYFSRTSETCIHLPDFTDCLIHSLLYPIVCEDLLLSHPMMPYDFPCEKERSDPSQVLLYITMPSHCIMPI